MERGDEVLILGPGETKRALARRIGQIKSLTGVMTRASAADKISDAALVTTIRKRYGCPCRRETLSGKLVAVLGWTGPQLGSVTYRVLCLTHSLVLALPPEVGA